jgi:hypothetical protein
MGAAAEAKVTVLRNQDSFLPTLSSACAPDGTYAVLFYDGELLEVHPDGSETRSFYPKGGVILYDSAGDRHVFVTADNGLHHYIHHRLTGDTAMEAVPGWINAGHNNIALGRDNRFRIVWSKWNEPVRYASNETGSWQTRVLGRMSGPIMTYTALRWTRTAGPMRCTAMGGACT